MENKFYKEILVKPVIKKLLYITILSFISVYILSRPINNWSQLIGITLIVILIASIIHIIPYLFMALNHLKFAKSNVLNDNKYESQMNHGRGEYTEVDKIFHYVPNTTYNKSPDFLGLRKFTYYHIFFKDGSETKISGIENPIFSDELRNKIITKGIAFPILRA